MVDVRASVRTSITSVDDLTAVLRLHHVIIATGSLCRGFPNLTSRLSVPQPAWTTCFVGAMRTILEALRVMSSTSVIREAVRSAVALYRRLSHVDGAQTISSFKVVVNCTGIAVLPLVPTLIDCILDKLRANELIEFLPFVSLLMHKYKVRARWLGQVATNHTCIERFCAPARSDAASRLRPGLPLPRAADIGDGRSTAALGTSSGFLHPRHQRRQRRPAGRLHV
jgi:hypothetical protein